MVVMQAVCSTQQVPYQGQMLDLEQPFRRATMHELVQEALGENTCHAITPEVTSKVNLSITCLAGQTGRSCLSVHGCMAQVHHASVCALCQLADTVQCECIMQSRASRPLRSQCFTRLRDSLC